MSAVLHRRELLCLLAGAGLTAWLPRSAAARQAARSGALPSSGPRSVPPGSLSASRLADHVLLISGAPGNVLVVDGPDGLVMVNGGASDTAGAISAVMAKELGARPVRTLFNTDWHPEHTGSNEMLGKAGAQIVAHEHTKQYLSTELTIEWQNRTYKPLPVPARPTRTFLTSGSWPHGTETLEYAHLGQAHTDGDISVFLKRANVLMTGDVLTVGRYPIADYACGGWLGGLATATKTLLDFCNDDTRVVPASGPVLTRSALQEQLAMLTSVRERLTKMMRQGIGAKEMVAAGPTKEFDAKWGSPDLFITTSYRGMWLHVREVGGVV